MNKYERLEQIVELLKDESAAGIKELAEHFSVSEMTIRRDLTALAEQGKIKLMHGGAVLKPGRETEKIERYYFISEESEMHIEEKREIGMKAASLIVPDDICIIDGGSTTEWLAKALPEDYSLTILCFALNILIETRYKNPKKLTFGGGDFHENTLVFESPETIRLIHRFRAKKTFVSAGGFHESLGVTCLNPYEIELKQAILQSSLERILLIDSSKFGRVQACHFAEPSDFTTIITDAGIPRHYAAVIRDAGLQLIII